MSRERSGAVSIVQKRTLLVIEDNWISTSKPEKILPKLVIGDKTYLVVATIGPRKTYDTFSGGPLARFLWRADTSLNPELMEFFKRRIRTVIDPPFYDDYEKKKEGLVKIHKVVCKGTTDSNNTYKNVLEDHFYVAKPLIIKQEIRDPIYTVPYPEVTEVQFGYTVRYPEGTEKPLEEAQRKNVLTCELMFIYDRCVKTSYVLDENEKSGQPIISSKKYSLYQVRDLIRTTVNKLI